MKKLRNTSIVIDEINRWMEKLGSLIRFRDEEDEDNPTSGWIKSSVGFCMRYKSVDEAHAILEKIEAGLPKITNSHGRKNQKIHK